MTLKEFGEKLEKIVPNTGHFKAKKTGFPRIIFGETERIYDYNDNAPKLKWWKVEVNFFTREHFDPRVDELEDFFISNGISFDLVAVQYGDTTMDGKTFDKGVIYYLFECEV